VIVRSNRKPKQGKGLSGSFIKHNSDKSDGLTNNRKDEPTCNRNARGQTEEEEYNEVMGFKIDWEKYPNLFKDMKESHAVKGYDVYGCKLNEDGTSQKPDEKIIKNTDDIIKDHQKKKGFFSRFR